MPEKPERTPVEPSKPEPEGPELELGPDPVESALMDYTQTKKALNLVFKEGEKWYETLPEEEAKKMWDLEVVPKIIQAKKPVRQASEDVLMALQEQYEQRQNELAKPGEYEFHVRFETESGKHEELSSQWDTTVDKRTRMSISELEKEASGWAVFFGLHNHGIKRDDNGFSRAFIKIINKQDPNFVIESKCWLEGGSGHIVNERTFSRMSDW